MRSNVQHHIQIAGRPAAQAGLAIAAGTQTRAGVHACRDAKFDFGSDFAASVSVTSATRFFDDAPRALTLRAGLRDAEDAARTDDLSASTADGAGFGAGTGFRAGAVAGAATFGFGDGDFLFATVSGFLEGDFQVVTQIVAALRLHGVGTYRSEERRVGKEC